MRLGISHGLNPRQARSHNTPHLIKVPILIRHILKQLNPEVGNCHTQTVVKADTTIFDRVAHARHTAHILCNGNCRRVDAMHQLIGKCKIYERIAINALVKELLAAVKICIAVMMIYHRGYAIKAVAVKVEYIHPILDIREQEVLNLALAVVKGL